MDCTLEQGEGGRVRLQGELSLRTVPALWPRLKALCAEQQAPVIDLSGVGRTDSGALVLLLELIGWCNGRGCGLRLEGIPAALLSIARLSNVDGLLAQHS